MSCNISDIVADETLFQEIQRGDEKAFDVLFLKYYPSLCAYAQRFVEYDDGQEIVQDVMVWLWENREMHTFEISPKSYLFKAVKNRCLTLISRNEIKQKIINTLYDNQQLEYEDPDFYIVEELSRKIEEALQRLPDSYREAFELNRFQHMTYGGSFFQDSRLSYSAGIEVASCRVKGLFTDITCHSLKQLLYRTNFFVIPVH